MFWSRKDIENILGDGRIWLVVEEEAWKEEMDEDKDVMHFLFLKS